jgi:hypothetical protein
MLWAEIGVDAFVLVGGFFLLLGHLGRKLPEEHVASLTLRLSQPQRLVWETVSDLGGHKNWAKGETKVERLADRDNHEVWRQHMGRNSFVLLTAECHPPQRLVRTIDDDNKFFSGDWTYELSPDGEGTRVKLTEHGRVSSSVARAMMHYLFGEKTYMRKHLVSLAQKFGEQARVEG